MVNLRVLKQAGYLWAAVLFCSLLGNAQTPPGSLSKEHSILSGPEHCNDCHILSNGSREFKCLDCHDSVREDQKSGRHPSLGDNMAGSMCAGCHSLHNAAGGSAPGNSEKKQGSGPGPHGQMRIPCGSCHTSTSYRPIRPFPDFKHSETAYPLQGMHVGVDCRQCHSKLTFTSVGKQCADCHADFHRRRMGSSCEQCHTVRGWRVTLSSTKNHTNRFPLLGAHAGVDCQSCHKEAPAGTFRGLSTDCASCHLRDQASAKAPDHQAARFPATCQSCHTGMDSWRAAKFDHGRNSGFLLTGGHAQLDCTSCHANRNYAGTSPDCVSCHNKDYSAAADPNHTTAGFSRNCLSCHTTAGWAGAKFDHETSARYALTGAHTAVDCRPCHAGGKYAGTSSSCYSCHAADFGSAKNPVHVNGTFSTDCTGCHTTASWGGGKFDHNLSVFRLSGTHAGVQCTTCHKNNIYTGLSKDCASCHLTDYKSTTNPNHAAANLAQDCSQCHGTVNWQGASLNHSAVTKFPLTGDHVGAQCVTCHKNNVYAGLSTACVSCHLADYNKVTSPNHAQGGFPQQCANCHNTNSWAGAKFDHGTTPFPLTGAHGGVQCASCHKNAGVSTACASCHLADYNKVTSPNHAQGGFPQQCTNCHNTTSWSGATFNHNSTPFPLTGAHAGTQCTSCHKSNVYTGVSTACASCHLTDYNNVTSPNHAQGGFPQQCTNCHNTTSWAGATFNHGATPFPLTGAHSGVQCASCHKNGVYAGLSTACSSCHLTDYNTATNPNHAQGGFPQQCTTCHNTTSWSGATFNHGTTPFPLTGAHSGVQCASCHKNGVYAGLSTACSACHLAAYTATTNPNHAQSGFPQDCSLCHSTTSFSGASFNHSNTPFPLTGAHVRVTCTSCHANNVYAGLPTSCVSCHLANYNSTTNPNHVQAGFPQQCSTCHSTVSWAGAVFNHNSTSFTLTGAHTSVQCNLCHINGRYAGTPTGCYSCHSAEYKNTTNPGHQGAGFPTTCATCHTTTAWTGATFNHTWWRTSHGGARTCSDCHTNPSDYKAFTCTTCHTKAQTDSRHAGRSGYVYNSANCYQCHRSGGN